MGGHSGISRLWAALTALLLLASCATTPENYTGHDAPSSAAIVPVKSARPVVGLVLGAGGNRGFAHVGAIKALQAAGIEADVIVGASSGALVASLYAGGLGAPALERMALETDDNDLLDITLFGPGLISGIRLQEFVNAAVRNRPIESLDKPFAAIAVERETQRMTVFNRGNTGIAVRASASIPKVFWPVTINGTDYIDGGLASRVPVPVARAMGADIVIAVDISRRGGSAEADEADIVIRPQTLRSRLNDFKHKLANIAAGEEAARAELPRIRERIAEVAREKAQRAALGPASLK